MRSIVSCLAVLFLPTLPLYAQTCEATFAKNGNPITGLRFTSAQSVAVCPWQMRSISCAASCSPAATTCWQPSLRREAC